MTSFFKCTLTWKKTSFSEGIFKMSCTRLAKLLYEVFRISSVSCQEHTSHISWVVFEHVWGSENDFLNHLITGAQLNAAGVDFIEVGLDALQVGDTVTSAKLQNQLQQR